MKKLGMLFLLAVVSSTSGAFASGLSIPEQGAAAMGLAGSVTARSGDLSSIFYNAAGISSVKNTELLLGLTPIRPNHSFEGAGSLSSEAKSQTYFPPQLFFAHRTSSRLVLGGGIYTPFGLGTDWGETWNGRYTSTYAEVQAIYITPTVAYQLTKWMSFGAGYSFVYSTAVIEKMIDSGLMLYSKGAGTASMASNTAFDSKFSLDGDGGGTNWNLGLQIRPTGKMQVGVAYRSKTDLEYDGTATFTHSALLSSAQMNALLAQMPASQDGATTLHLPGTTSVGILYNVTDRLDASLDVNYTDWSTYDNLSIELENGTSTQEKNWEDTYCFRLGSSYAFNPATVLRGGLIYDQNPVPDDTFDAQLPDGDRMGFSLGYGHRVGNISLDFSYLFLTFTERDKDNYVGYRDVNSDGVVDATDQTTLDTLSGGSYSTGTGSYSSHVNMFSASASFKF